MARFIKVIGSGRDACPEPYREPYVDFSPARNPRGKVNIGDELILYAAGGRKTVFAQATIVSQSYGGDNPEWPYRVDVEYMVNVSPADGVLINEVSIGRDLGTVLRRQSYVRIEDDEFEQASELLFEAGERAVRKRRHFTTYWRNDTWRNNSQDISYGELLEHTSSDHFIARGILPNDAVYIVTAIKGRLHVAAKIIVGEILDTSKAESVLGRTDLWEAKDHIIASHSTQIGWGREIPVEITRRLEFVSPSGDHSRPVFRVNDELDEQTLRGVRKLSNESAMLIDEYLGPLKAIDFVWDNNRAEAIASLKELESFAEGKKGYRYVTYYERDPKNRENAIRIHGFDCKGCGINFEDTYGDWGKDFIHVHHIKPVSQFETPTTIDPRTDLTVLCPNCHAMVHRKKTRTLSLEELQRLMLNATESREGKP